MCKQNRKCRCCLDHYATIYIYVCGFSFLFKLKKSNDSYGKMYADYHNITLYLICDFVMRHEKFIWMQWLFFMCIRRCTELKIAWIGYDMLIFRFTFCMCTSENKLHPPCVPTRSLTRSLHTHTEQSNAIRNSEHYNGQRNECWNHLSRIQFNPLYHREYLFICE